MYAHSVIAVECMTVIKIYNAHETRTRTRTRCLFLTPKQLH